MEQFREKIEQHGNYYEKHGFSPVASRVMIYLFLHPEGEATFEDLIQYFGVSKSAISNALKILSVMQIVSERTKGGTRKRYFQASLRIIFSPATMLKNYRETRLILEDIKKLRKKRDKVADDFSDIIDFMKLLEKEYPELYRKVQEEGARKRSGSGL